MKKPTLSVIMPNYNHGQYLPISLQAILDQSLPPDEIIVIDDASTDNSVEILERFAKKYPSLHFYRNPENRGGIHTANRGIELSRGDYIFGAAADDEVVPGFFEKSLALLGRHPQAALSFTIGDFREAATGLNWHWGVSIAETPCYLSPADLVAAEKRRGFYMPANSVIFKRSALAEVGYFIPDLKFCCDWYAAFVSAFRHGVCFVPEPLAIFHVQPNSYYHRLRREETEYTKVIEELLKRLSQPENKDVLPLLREAGSLFLFASPMLKLMLLRPEYRHFITPCFLRRNLSHSAKLFLKNHAPASLVKFYLKHSGYRATVATVP